MRVCADKDLEKFVNAAVRRSGWSIERGSKHFIAISPRGAKLPIPNGSGGPKNLVMWRSQFNRISAAEAAALH